MFYWWSGHHNRPFHLVRPIFLLWADIFQRATYRMPIIDKFKDMGTVVMGKVESGSIQEGESLVVMPNKVNFLELTYIFTERYSSINMLFCPFFFCRLK